MHFYHFLVNDHPCWLNSNNKKFVLFLESPPNNNASVTQRWCIAKNDYDSANPSNSLKTQLIRSEAHDGKTFIGSPCEVQKWSFYTASGWVPNSGIQIKDEKSIMAESKLMDKLKKDKAIADQKVTDLETKINKMAQEKVTLESKVNRIEDEKTKLESKVEGLENQVRIILEQLKTKSTTESADSLISNDSSTSENCSILYEPMHNLLNKDDIKSVHCHNNCMTLRVNGFRKDLEFNQKAIGKSNII